MATDFVASFAKFADPTLIRHAGITKRIVGSQYWFQGIKWQWFFYIV